MERIWSPWRYAYIAAAETDMSVCIFCEAQQDPDKDQENYVVYRAEHNFVILNRYPYITGHLMVAPFAHVGELDAASKAVSDEMMDLAKRCQAALRHIYRPDGFNLGMNLGRPAGAGIADHLHIHIMPRWAGDTNFMSTIANTRVIPEDLATTYQKLKGHF